MKWRGWQTKPLLFALYHCDPAQWFLLGLPLYDVLSGWSALGPVWPFYSFICLLLSLAFSPLGLWLALWSVCRVREMIIGQWTLVEHSLCCSLSQRCQLLLLNEWCLMVKKYWIRLWLVLKKKHLLTLISTFTCLETHNSPVGAGIESSDYKADLLTRNVTIDLIILAYF